MRWRNPIWLSGANQSKERMILKFPELAGGTVQGLNDAGVENFQGAIDSYLARECGQNTGDAPRPGIDTVRLEFDRLEVHAGDIPGFSQLRSALDSSLERWRSKDKEREFFEQAVSLAAQPRISVLKISDFGTTGLTGDDQDELGRWFALVKSQGVSNKDDTAGGSFGIGKSSPFAASRFRTVFYGTRLENGAVALQGVSRLVTHKNAEGKLTQGTGFIGDHGTDGQSGEPVFRAVRVESRIPSMFRRTETGTDIWVVGYRSGSEWSTDLTRSILANFWPAINRGTIEFRVGHQKINKANLASLIQGCIGQEDFEAHHFFKAVSSQPAKKTLRHTGTCELYLTASSLDLPKKVCMVRNNGMRIFDYQPKACRVPFSGLFLCTDPEGNKLLRKLEPPKHDIWDPKRTEDSSGKKALEEIKLWIREEVKKLNPLFAGKSFNESELAKYLPDSSTDDPTDLPFDSAGQSDEEKLEPSASRDPKDITQSHAKPIVTKPGTSDDGGNGTGRTGRKGSGGGGKGTRTKGSGGSSDDPTPPTIKARSYRPAGDGLYEVVLRADEDFSGAVRVQAVGEDGACEAVSLTSATLPGGKASALTVQSDLIQGVEITAGEPLRLVVRTADAERRSLIVTPEP